MVPTLNPAKSNTPQMICELLIVIREAVHKKNKCSFIATQKADVGKSESVVLAETLCHQQQCEPEEQQEQHRT